ncbi:hypothetical protein HYU07_04775 [Candidatus Woesearchaeota archaeon]|nr:hypothetical protein [Candidatus Woesearchaeota archaeon]
MVNIKKIIKSLPADYSRHTVRDLSALTASIFAETYDKTFKRIFGYDFSSNLWAVKDDSVNFYRSQSEHEQFDKFMGEKVIANNMAYSKHLAAALVKYTNWINDFMKNNSTLTAFLKRRKEFIDSYRLFFAYHQAVYWAGDYASKISAAKETSEKVEILKAAYKYNELVVPDAEKYFKSIGVSKLLCDELAESIDVNKSKKWPIGILFLNKKRIILNKAQVNEIEALIEKRNELKDKNIKEIKGIAVSRGIYKGRVKAIKDLNKLDQANKGDVLVTIMTRPQFNVCLKNVGAIITDDGGMLCHAAILAREFNIPAVVGTKIATKVLKNGDLVEVDANHGVIKIIK